MNENSIQRTIGQLNESSLHRTIKYYICSNENQHEVIIRQNSGKLLGIADVFIEDTKTIYEIQTKKPYRLKEKIKKYIENKYNVIIVCPIVNSSEIHWIDPNSGNTVDIRRQTKRMNDLSIFDYMYQLREFTGQISYTVYNLDTVEYKYLDGRGMNKKIKATKIDKIPIRINSIKHYNIPKDLDVFIPQDLRNIEFDSKTFAKQSKVNISLARTQLLMLTNMGVIQRVDKNGKQIIYRYL